ncbi:MAG TPA: hypothetical protein VE956_00555 [Nodularia sp. (in: cyanobacteria)]|nr:hypothetical protein [Nodularia sp. (in: cyanobacteria)]
MAVHPKQIQKLIVKSVPIIVVAAIAIIGQSSSLVIDSSTKATSIHEVAASPRPTPTSPARNQTRYRSQRLGFEFQYSGKDFVVNDAVSLKNSSNSILAIIDIWTQEHAQKIRAGAYEGGTEYPANVNITIYKNPKRLPLQRWLQQSQEFVAASKLKNTKVAGQNAVQFESTGLYEHKKVAFLHPKNANVIVFNLAQDGNKKNEAKYQALYKQMISSFTFNR